MWLIWNPLLIFSLVSLLFRKTTGWLPTVRSLVAKFSVLGLEWLYVVLIVSASCRLNWFVQFIWDDQMVVLASPNMMLNLWIQRKTRFSRVSQRDIVIVRFRAQLSLVSCYLVVRLRRSRVVVHMRSPCFCPCRFCFKRRFQLGYFQMRHWAARLREISLLSGSRLVQNVIRLSICISQCRLLVWLWSRCDWQLAVLMTCSSRLLLLPSD